VPITDITEKAVLNPTIEAIDDVKVQVHTFDAEMGFTGGGVFNSAARSAPTSSTAAASFRIASLGTGRRVLRQ
jgi:hypothetical protein